MSRAFGPSFGFRSPVNLILLAFAQRIQPLVTLTSFSIPCKASYGRLVCPARRVSGKGNWDPPRYTACCGWPHPKSPTYSAFWSVFGVRCPRLQRLTLHVGFGTGTLMGLKKPQMDTDDGTTGSGIEGRGRRSEVRRQRTEDSGADSKVAIDFAPVAHSQEMDNAGRGIEGVDDPVIPDAQSVALATG